MPAIADIAQLSERTEARVAVQQVLCSHCGLGVLAADVVIGDPEQFCCAGCRTAFAIIQDSGLGAYHNLPERRGMAVGANATDYAYLDHPAFHEAHVRLDPEGVAHTTLQLSGVHCASCVWLIERVPLIVPGVQRAELNMRRHVVDLQWDPRSTLLSQIAGTLASLGYAPQPIAEGALASTRRREDRTMLIHIAVSGAIAMNVMLASLASYSGLSGSDDRALDLFVRWLTLGLTIPSLIWPGRTFFRGAVAAIRTRSMHLDLPIAVALAVGFGRGAVNTWRGEGPIYFDALTVLVFLLLVGRYIQQRWTRRASDAADLFEAVTPSTAQTIGEDGRVTSIPTAAVQVDALVVVAAGTIAPADGIVLSGSSHVDRAWLTGESTPCAVAVGQQILAGTRNLDHDLIVRVTAAGRLTSVGRLMEDVQRESERRPAVAVTANRLAGVFIAFVLVAAVATYLVRTSLADPLALDAAIAVLIVTCPCALAMATPLAINVAVGRAAQRGVLVRSGDALLVLAGRGTIYLDKTGTLTEGRMAVSWWEGDESAKSVILALEADSVHPIAEAFRRSWSGIIPLNAEVVQHHSAGISGSVAGTRWHVGSRRFIESLLGRPVAPMDSIPAHMTEVFLTDDSRVVACAGLTDPVRPDAEESVSALRRRGWHVSMLTGDTEGPAYAVASATGIAKSEVHALATPDVKLAVVRDARERGEVVMVGDGVNDTAALSASSAGVAMHGGAEVAMRCADAYLTHAGLGPFVELVDAARRTRSVIYGLLVASLAYNVAAIVLAFAGHISPLMAAILMPISSVTVIALAWRSNPFRVRT